MVSNNPTIAKVNDELDHALNKKFASAELVINTIRLVLNVNGIGLPGILNPEQEDEIVFEFEKDGMEDLYFYICLDQDERGHYDAYAQIVDSSELDAMRGMDASRPPLSYGQLVSHWLRQTRRTSDR